MGILLRARMAIACTLSRVRELPATLLIGVSRALKRALIGAAAIHEALAPLPPGKRGWPRRRPGRNSRSTVPT